MHVGEEVRYFSSLAFAEQVMMTKMTLPRVCHDSLGLRPSVQQNQTIQVVQNRPDQEPIASVHEVRNPLLAYRASRVYCAICRTIAAGQSDEAKAVP